MFPAGAGQLSRGPPPFWVGWCFSGVFGVWIRLLRTSSCCSSSCCGPIEPGQRVAAVNKLVDTKIKGRKPPILLVLNIIVSPYLPLFLILPWIITPVCISVNRYFRPKAKNFSRKTAITYEGNHGSSRGRPVPKLATYRIRRNVGFLLMGVWEFAQLLAARARCLICQALVIHRVWVTMGVWEFASLYQLPYRSGRPGNFAGP